MTHRIPNRRWLDNPEHKVGQAQLNRVQQAENRSGHPADSQQREPAREARAAHRIQHQ